MDKITVYKILMVISVVFIGSSIVIAGNYLIYGYSPFHSDYNPDIPYYRDSAPNGIYKQGTSGTINDGEWYFGLCEHGKTVENAWGPLHGTFRVTNSTIESLSLTELTYGGYMINWDSYPEHSRLYVEVKDNIIVGAWLR